MYHDPRNLIKSSTEGISQAIEDSNKIITKLLRLMGSPWAVQYLVKQQRFYTSATYTPFRVPHDGRLAEYVIIFILACRSGSLNRAFRPRRFILLSTCNFSVDQPPIWS